MNPEVTIQGSDIKCDLLLLKSGIDPNQNNFASDHVKMVIEVKNSGFGAKILKKGKSWKIQTKSRVNSMNLNQ